MAYKTSKLSRSLARSASLGGGFPWAGWLSLGVLYIVWGTTYLAIRVALGGGLPLVWLGALRFPLSALLLLGVALLGGERVWIGWPALRRLARPAVLLWLVGNGSMMWALKRIDAGYGALMMACTPIWVGLVEAWLDRRPPARRLVGWWLVGATGIAVLSLPRLGAGDTSSALAPLALLGASCAWAWGLVLKQRTTSRTTGARTQAGWEMAIASLVFVPLAFVVDPSGAQLEPDFEAWWALAYLVVFGSLAFAAFAVALRELPSRVVMTYAYVNPLLAVTLGWILLGESAGLPTAAGGGLVLVALYGIMQHERAVG